MNYQDLKQKFQKLKHSSPKEDMTAHIIFTEDSFTRPYPLLSRTYRVSSDNKAFWPKMGGYSIFGYCLDGSDQGARLDWYMAEEGNYNGWKVEDCYILEQMQDAEMVPYFTQTRRKDGLYYHFGDTFLHAQFVHENGKIRLEPLDGYQITHGMRVELGIDKLYGYCTLLMRYLGDKLPKRST